MPERPGRGAGNGRLGLAEKVKKGRKKGRKTKAGKGRESGENPAF
jgi:hypothetical protein